MDAEALSRKISEVSRKYPGLDGMSKRSRKVFEVVRKELGKEALKRLQDDPGPIEPLLPARNDPYIATALTKLSVTGYYVDLSTIYEDDQIVEAAANWLLVPDEEAGLEAGEWGFDAILMGPHSGGMTVEYGRDLALKLIDRMPIDELPWNHRGLALMADNLVGFLQMDEETDRLLDELAETDSHVAKLLEWRRREQEDWGLVS